MAIAVDIKHRSFEETLLACVAVGGVDTIVTSPPYCDARTAGAYGVESPWREEQYKALGDACFGALKPGGHAIINVDAPVREWRPGFGTERGFHAWRMMLDWAERVGFRVPDRLAFARLGLPGAYSGRFRNDWEPLLWFQKPGDGFFDKTPLNGVAKYVMSGRSSSRRRDGTFSHRRISGEAADSGVMRRGTLWQYDSVGHQNTGSSDIEAARHPASFPLRLALDVIACFSPETGTVCDPFMGAGTTAVACAMLKRSVVGGGSWEQAGGRTIVVRHRQRAGTDDPEPSTAPTVRGG